MERISSLLLIEDNPGDTRLLREMFNDQGVHNTRFMHVETMADADRHLSAHTVDVILLDLGLPDAKGVEAVRRAHAAAPGTPLVVLTGTDDENLALEALHEGAQDYLIKGQIEIRGLMRALRYAVERESLEEALFVERERAQVTLNSIGDAVVRRDGFELPIDESVALIHDREGRETGTVVVFHDVTAARAASTRLEHIAQHDHLTGLPNRMLLHDRIGQAIALAPRHKKKVAVLFLDLNGFKQINDEFGHATGDQILQSVAGRLVHCVRGSDTVSRVYPQDGLDAATLIRSADSAMYSAKKSGLQHYQFFSGVGEHSVSHQWPATTNPDTQEPLQSASG